MFKQGTRTGLTFGDLTQLEDILSRLPQDDAVQEQQQEQHMAAPSPRPVASQPAFASVKTLAISAIAIAGVTMAVRWQDQHFRALLHEIMPGTLSSGSIRVTRHDATDRPREMQGVYHPLYHPDPDTCGNVVGDNANERVALYDEDKPFSISNTMLLNAVLQLRMYNPECLLPLHQSLLAEGIDLHTLIPSDGYYAGLSFETVARDWFCLSLLPEPAKPEHFGPARDAFGDLFQAIVNDDVKGVLNVLDGVPPEQCETLVNQYDKSQNTRPLHSAASHGSAAIVKVLISKGVNVNAKDKDHRTALHLAYLHGHDAVVKVLLANKAEVEAKDKQGKTPLELDRTGRAHETMPNQTASRQASARFDALASSSAASASLASMPKGHTAPSANMDDEGHLQTAHPSLPEQALTTALSGSRGINVKGLVAALKEHLDDKAFGIVAECFRKHSSAGRRATLSAVTRTSSASEDRADKAVVVWGSVNVDIIATLEDGLPLKNENKPAKASLYAPGGKGANESVATARLGVTTQFFANVGGKGDLYGSLCLNALEEADVGVEHVVTREGEATGTALVMTAEKKGKYTAAHSGANNTESEEQLQELAEFFDNQKTYTHFLTQLEANLANTVKACKIAKEKGRTVVVKFSPFQKGQSTGFLNSNVDWLIVNEHEAPALAAELNGVPSDGAAKTLMEGFEHIKTIASKTGVPTIVLITPFGSLTRETVQVGDKQEIRYHLVDTAKPDEFGGLIGAADAFAGGLVAAGCWGRPLHEALVWGHAAASLCLESPQAQDSLPSLDQLKERLQARKLPASINQEPTTLPEGSSEMIQAVLDGSLSKLNDSQRDFQGMSALHLAILAGNEQLCYELIHKNSSLLAVADCRGRVPRELVDAKKTPKLAKLVWFYHLMNYLKEGIGNVGPACDVLQDLDPDTTPKDIESRKVATIVAEYAIERLAKAGSIGDCIEARLCDISSVYGDMVTLLNHESNKGKNMHETCLYASVKGGRTGFAYTWLTWIKKWHKSEFPPPLQHLSGALSNGRNLLHAGAESGRPDVFETIYALLKDESQMPNSPTKLARSTSFNFGVSFQDRRQTGPADVLQTVQKQKDLLASKVADKAASEATEGQSDKVPLADLFDQKDQDGKYPYQLATNLELVKRMRSEASMKDVFLSYSHKRCRKEVEGLYTKLAEKELSIWMDFEIESGSEWASEISAQASNCKAIVIVWTPEWEASGHCTAEYRLAKTHGAKVFVVLPDKGAETPTSSSVLHAESKVQFFYLTNPVQLAAQLLQEMEQFEMPSVKPSAATHYKPPGRDQEIQDTDLIVFHHEKDEDWVFALLDSQPNDYTTYCCAFNNERMDYCRKNGQRAIFVYSDAKECSKVFEDFLHAWGSKRYSLLTLHQVKRRGDSNYSLNVNKPRACLSVSNFLSPESKQLQADAVEHASDYMSQLIQKLYVGEDCNLQPAASNTASSTPVPPADDVHDEAQAAAPSIAAACADGNM
eukprot:m.270125 g.270125  ORF g.270125 m.270125 type:complete len:1488 (+) comp17666_c0_seq11:676-5139(+)